MKNKRNKGITLIALVVTIIVLLILAGISVQMLTGNNGILTKAGEARDLTGEKQVTERVQLAYLAALTEGKGEATEPNLISELNKEFGAGNYTLKKVSGIPKGVTISGKDYYFDGTVTVGEQSEDSDTLNAGEKATATKNNYNGVIIPEGFTVSGADTENNILGGLVIYRIDDNATINWNNETELELAKQSYDQFVWVPVEVAYIEEDEIPGNTPESTDTEKYNNLKTYCSTNGIYPMAIKIGNNFKELLYMFSFNLPLTITPDDYTASYNNKDPQASLLEEYNTMITSVNSNGGFWVGRYETSNMNGNINSDDTQQIEVKKGATEGVSDDGTGITWQRMYAQQKNYANKIGLNKTSSMIWENQWDQIMIWMKDINNTMMEQYKYIVNSCGMGNFNLYSTDDGCPSTSAPVSTGYSEAFKVNNIYDLARKCW